MLVNLFNAVLTDSNDPPVVSAEVLNLFNIKIYWKVQNFSEKHLDFVLFVDDWCAAFIWGR